MYGGPSVPLFTTFFNGKTGVLNGSFKLNRFLKPNFDCVNVYLRKNFMVSLIIDSKEKVIFSGVLNIQLIEAQFLQVL